MARKRLIDEVSVQEMQQMRDGGMTNRQIAEALDVGYSTVCHYLGKQPKGLRAALGTYSTPKDDTPEEKPPVLQKLSHVEEYEGARNRYIVRRDMGVVTIRPTGDCVQFDKEGLEHYITELLDILTMI